MKVMKDWWNHFAERHPSLSQWVREGGLFIIVSNAITVFKYVLLTFLPGATVEGAEGLFDLSPGGGAALPYIAESEAATVAALRADFNALLLALREAGLMREPPGDAT